MIFAYQIYLTMKMKQVTVYTCTCMQICFHLLCCLQLLVLCLDSLVDLFAILTWLYKLGPVALRASVTI